MFIALRSTNKLYGIVDGLYVIHEIDIPFLLNTDIEFTLSKDAVDIIDKYDSYFVPDEFPWIALPSIYWDMYSSGDIYAYYTEATDYLLYDKTTKQPLDQVQLHPVMYNHSRKVFRELMDGYFNRLPTLKEPIVFPEMHKDEAIRTVLDGKSADGAKLCILRNGNYNIPIYMYKGIISMAKNDTLSIDIRYDKFSTGEFMATFKPVKKKDPLKSNKYGIPFRECVHVMYLDIC